MRHALTRSILIFALTLAASTAPSSAVVLFTYDFPGLPAGSGLATDQANSQPANATFGDFTRTATLTTVTSGPGNNDFGTSNWNETGSIDPTEHEGFSITAAGGYHLNLTSLSFDARVNPTGPTNVEVGLFLNGSSTATATFDITPTGSVTTYTFDFTDLTDADNATTAEFRFYGWNAIGTGGSLFLDNVVTNGAVTNAVAGNGLVWDVASRFGCVFVRGKGGDASQTRKGRNEPLPRCPALTVRGRRRSFRTSTAEADS